jgi:hypothetical protein
MGVIALGSKIIADTVHDIIGSESRADLCDLEILHTEVEASVGKWERFETFHQEVLLSFDDRFVEHFSRMLILAIRYAINVDAPQGELIQRLKAATAIQWLLPDEYRPGGMHGIILEDNHVLVAVPEELRKFAFPQAAQLPDFNDPKVLDTFGELPLGHPVFRMDLALVEPASGCEAAAQK